ncbi:nitrogenase molybdenum-iron protein alpha chain [Pontiella sulfatireligans]|uniref:Nitrogenase protein alpha chain n=1 Tax=Pontiella sulfatireligans TaxID=2750658 RepID=A0A6C2UQ56_9BACT|nr:nitrogenase molybdenum-iron protein alpha chain [Pontiella sulfatireligans]VGO22415.1 Nitrogenase molybdenum-iron protein alpha chain [Pontiella sulfatireligans]
MSEDKKLPDPSIIKEEILAKYPPKIARKRAKSMVVVDKSMDQEVQSNVRTIPGIITQRGCCYAGCKGVVLGPTRDIINLVHGPIGCSFYAWLTRRNQTDPGEAGPDGENFINYCFSTDMQDSNIVFGGEKKLKQAIQEAYDIFKPKAIGVFSTCPVGLIGDDVHAVSREMKEKFGDCNVFGFSCEGYKGVSQSAGHHIANNQLFKHVIGRDNTQPEGKYNINLLGEYNIGGDAFELDRIFELCGINVISTFSGNSNVTGFERSHTADLNLVMCHRSINYVAEMMETKYGIPWFKVNFIGGDATAKSLRRIGEYYEDPELIARIEEVITAELPSVKQAAKDVLKTTDGKLAMMFVGGSRAHHYQELFAEMGMTTVSAGYEFAHRDDYEGRKVLPTIKVDADSRNIEELKIEADPELYNPRKTKVELEDLEKNGLEFSEYKGMKNDMADQSLIVDDISHWEADKLIEYYKPDIFCAGIKEKYVVQKMGIPLKQLHSYDYGGPYAGFEGAKNFYTDIERMLSTSIWKKLKAPWLETGASDPCICAEYVA